MNEFGTSEELLAKMEREKNGEAVGAGDATAAAVANGDVATTDEDAAPAAESTTALDKKND